MEKRVLIERWLRTENQPLPIYDEASVSAARLRVREAGRLQNLSDEIVESVALIASELAHNHLSHARQGYFAVKAIQREGVRGLEIIAADLGPGIEKPGHAIEDSVPSERSLRAGLSAVLRIADEVEFDNRITEGTCVVARKFEKEAPALSAQIAIMGRPYPGEIISGDDAVFIQSDSGFVAAVSDGLGHGPEARQASNLALAVLISNSGLDFDALLLSLNEELSRTRGCAMSIARFNRSNRVLESVSAGDVHSHLYAGRQAQFFAATPFILGAGQLSKHRPRIEKATAEPGSVLVMFTDGLKSRTNLKGQLDVLRQPPIAIAQHLLEHDSRPDDDALVLVARFR